MQIMNLHRAISELPVNLTFWHRHYIQRSIFPER